MTAEDLDTFLRGLGLTVEMTTGADNDSYTVVRDFEIPAGALRGRRCDVAIRRDMSVPYVTPAAIHTRPALVRMEMVDPIKTQPSPIGDGWQYWSRRFDRTPTPQGIWTHILTVLCDPQWQPV